jgi:hypothetical protein
MRGEPVLLVMRLRCPRPLFYVPGASAFSTLSYTLELYAAHISSSFR